MPEQGARGSSTRAWAAALVASVALLAGVALYVLEAARRVPGDAVREGARGLAEIAAAFRSGTVTTSFVSYATQLSGTRLLQFARLRETEVFERRDEMTVLWGALALPDVVIEARASVEYTYYLDLDKPWRFRLDGASVEATVPPIEWNAPALDVSSLSFVVREGSVFRDEALVKERLRASLTPLLARRAQQHVALVRETGRRQTEGFLEKWLKDRFADGGAHRARVVFADDAPASR
jgi:hypothetical protein